jgi:hypothetical protein
MAWSISDLFPPWGDTGERPSDNFQYDGGDQVNEKHLDYLWDNVAALESEVRSALTDIDSDKDGIVDEADTANLYKGNDIDSDGDGKVDNAVNADRATTADQVWDADARYDYWSNHEIGTVPAGDFVPIGTFALADNETLEVTQASLTADGFDTAAPSGIDLIVAENSGTTSTELKATILSGDGTTFYNDETGSPLASYQNTSGSEQTVVIAINNGDFGQSGVGSSQTAAAQYIARTV